MLLFDETWAGDSVFAPAAYITAGAPHSVALEPGANAGATNVIHPLGEKRHLVEKHQWQRHSTGIFANYTVNFVIITVFSTACEG